MREGPAHAVTRFQTECTRRAASSLQRSGVRRNFACALSLAEMVFPLADAWGDMAAGRNRQMVLRSAGIGTLSQCTEWVRDRVILYENEHESVAYDTDHQYNRYNKKQRRLVMEGHRGAVLLPKQRQILEQMGHQIRMVRQRRSRNFRRTGRWKKDWRTLQRMATGWTIS